MKLLKSTVIAAAIAATGVIGSAHAATDTTTFQVLITITESCSFSTAGATDVDFGSKARAEAGDVDNTGTLVVNCTQDTPFDIGLDAGAFSGATVTTRQMSNLAGTSSIPYSLYSDSGRTQNWGNTIGTDTLAGVGTGVDQPISVYGRVLGGADVNVPAGAYTDTVTATITY